VRIALAGAGGVGKGTLGKKIAEYTWSIFIPSHIKDTGIMMGMSNSYQDKIGVDQELAFQHAIMFGQIYQERALQEAKLQYVAERTTLDYIPYYLERGFSPDAAYVQAARKWAVENYDLVVYIPVEFEAQDKEENAWKERDREKQERTSGIIKRELDSLRIPYVRVTGSVDLRFKQVKHRINTMMADTYVD
jgi:adenylate kinase family enzyme